MISCRVYFADDLILFDPLLHSDDYESKNFEVSILSTKPNEEEKVDGQETSPLLIHSKNGKV